MKLKPKQLIKDFQRNVDYAFEKGIQTERKRIIDIIEKWWHTSNSSIIMREIEGETKQ